MEVGVVVLIVNVINIKDFCEQIRDLLSWLTIRFPTFELNFKDSLLTMGLCERKGRVS